MAAWNFSFSQYLHLFVRAILHVLGMYGTGFDRGSTPQPGHVRLLGLRNPSQRNSQPPASLPSRKVLPAPQEALNRRQLAYLAVGVDENAADGKPGATHEIAEAKRRRRRGRGGIRWRRGNGSLPPGGARISIELLFAPHSPAPVKATNSAMSPHPKRYCLPLARCPSADPRAGRPPWCQRFRIERTCTYSTPRSSCHTPNTDSAPM